MSRLVLTGYIFLCAAAAGFGQGSLTPPGAPGATMKTLEQVEPRTPVSGSTTITQSGSYYLTGSVAGGITISADDVTLDLMGYSIEGSGTGNGLTISSGVQDAVVCNGSIHDFSSGIVVVGAIGCRFENVMIADNASYGIYMNGASGHCNGNTVRKCTIISSGADGIHLIGGGAGECGYNILQDCIVGNNSGKGIYVEEQSADACRGNEISGCTIIGNIDTEVRVEGDQNRIVGNVLKDSSGSGSGLEVQGSQNRVSGNTVQGHADNYNFTVGNQLDLLISEIPESIDWSSSVKLAGSLVGSNGISVTVSDVTVDLGGFTLRGELGFESYGIRLVGSDISPLEHVWIKNGTLRNFYAGLWGTDVNHSRFNKLVIGDNSEVGVVLGGCDGCRLTDCMVSGNGSGGVYFISSVGSCDGNIVENCTVADNGGSGLGIDGSYSPCNGNRITDCAINGNDGWGIYLYAFDGACVGNSIMDCTLFGNDLMGIYVNSADSNRIEGNHISGTKGTPTTGIITTNCQNNLVIRNFAIGHNDNFSLDTDDTYGPEITTSGALSGTDPAANFSF